VFYHSQGHLDKARPFYEEARQIAMQGGYISSHLDEASSRRIWTSDTDRLKNYARLLLALAVQRPSATSLHADAFEVLEQARGWVVQSTIARMLARRAGKTPEERRLTDRLEELRKERSLLWSKLQQSYASADTGEHKAEPNELKRNLSQVEQELNSLGKQVRRLLPRYAELSTPGTIPVAEAQQYLGTGEALISYYYLDRGLKTWVVRPGQPVAFYDVQIEHDVLTSLVKALRDSLSPEYGAYNIGAARRLYQLLIGPLESKLEGCTHLLIVPDPLMVGLPFPALIAPSMVTTQPDRRPDDLRAVPTNYAALPWLVRKYASTVLPSASSLRLIRQRSREASASIPFMGFGNPLLRHTQPTTPGGDTKQTSSMSGRELATRTARIFTDLQPLPGTARELAAVARALHADPDRHLYMGDQATEATVKRLSREGFLGQAEIVSFATHALVPSEFEGIMQPTLVMTPPASGTDEDDGLLSMEEILELELGHTWWVILSACNTGFGATSEQGLSGLARSFFYAGARSLLVSHWSVDDHATEVLMKQIFQRYGDNPHLSPAEAIRGGMLALLDGTSGDPYPFLTHPYAWASFFLIGEGSRRPGL
jgi:CHAT domain-containing protein